MVGDAAPSLRESYASERTSFVSPLATRVRAPLQNRPRRARTNNSSTFSADSSAAGVDRLASSVRLGPWLVRGRPCIDLLVTPDVPLAWHDRAMESRSGGSKGTRRVRHSR